MPHVDDAPWQLQLGSIHGYCISCSAPAPTFATCMEKGAGAGPPGREAGGRAGGWVDAAPQHQGKLYVCVCACAGVRVCQTAAATTIMADAFVPACCAPPAPPPPPLPRSNPSVPRTSSASCSSWTPSSASRPPRPSATTSSWLADLPPPRRPPRGAHAALRAVCTHTHTRVLRTCTRARRGRDWSRARQAGFACCACRAVPGPAPALQHAGPLATRMPSAVCCGPVYTHPRSLLLLLLLGAHALLPPACPPPALPATLGPSTPASLASATPYLLVARNALPPRCPQRLAFSLPLAPTTTTRAPCCRS